MTIASINGWIEIPRERIEASLRERAAAVGDIEIMDGPDGLLWRPRDVAPSETK